MKGVNRVILIGNLGQDPEIKYVASGTAIANLSIATSENRKNAQGEWTEHTEWHRIVLFGKTAEVAKDYLHKGSRIYIEGRLQTRSWDDQNGQKRYMTEIVGNNLVMLDGSQQQGGGTGQQTKGGGKGHDGMYQPPPPDDIYQTAPDDNLPF